MSNRDYDRERYGESDEDWWRSRNRDRFGNYGRGGERSGNYDWDRERSGRYDWDRGRYGFDQGRDYGRAPWDYSQSRWSQEGDWDQGGYGRENPWGRREQRGQWENRDFGERGRGYYGQEHWPEYGRGTDYGRGGSRFGWGTGQGEWGGRGYQPGSQRGYGWEYEGIEFGRGFRQGEHSGKGPRNYQRSDDRIREDVNDRLTDHPELDPTDINAQVHNGEVTLTGEVNSRWDKRLAEDVAWGVSGIKNVHNQISVRQFGQTTREEQRAA